MVCVVQLHKTAHALWRLAETGAEALPDADYQTVTLDQLGNRWRTAELLERFTGAEVNPLWDGFAELDYRLRVDRGQDARVAGEPSEYDQYDMPRDFDVEDFVASWERS